MGFSEVAQQYYDMGFSIMPLKSGDKRPFMAWEKYQNERVSQEQLNEWIKTYPFANIAIITGKVSGNIVVIDIDGSEGTDAIRGLSLSMPPTRVAKTGKGYHYFYKYVDPIGNHTGILPKVDIRGDGGYVVAPGSIHPSGAQYVWSIEDEIAPVPDWVYNQIKASKEKVVKAELNENAQKKKERTELERLKAGVGEGERDNACAKLVGHYLAKEYAMEDVRSLMLTWNTKNNPPLEAEDILKTINSIYKANESKDTEKPIEGIEPIDLKACKTVISKWLYLKDDSIVDVAAATVVSTFHTGDPLWIIFVGAPSTGKTEILRGFDRHRDVYFIDRITPSTFVTGFTRAKGILERMGSDPKTFIIQDFSTILSKPPYDRMEIVDTLRQVYNGTYHNEWGNGKKFTWRGKIALIAGCTPDIEAHSYTMGELGERFLYYRVDGDDDETRHKMMDKAKYMEGKEAEARKEITTALHGVIESCKNRSITDVKIGDSYEDWISNLVDMTSSLRSVVKRNPYRREIIEYAPHKEGPGRMLKACQVLLKSLAIVRGRSEVNDDDYAIVVKVCVDSIQSVRREALRVLKTTFGRGGIRPKDVANKTGYHGTENISYHLADLSALGLVDRWLETNATNSMNAPFVYELKKETYKKLEASGMIDII